MDHLKLNEFDMNSMTKYPMILIITKNIDTRIKLIDRILTQHGIRENDGLILDSVDKFMNQYTNAYPNAKVSHWYDQKIIDNYIYHQGNYIIFDIIRNMGNIPNTTFNTLYISLKVVIVCVSHPIMIPSYQRHMFNYIFIASDNYTYIYSMLHIWYKKLFPQHTNPIHIDLNNKDFLVIDNSNYDAQYINKLRWLNVIPIQKNDKQNYPSDKEIYNGEYVLPLTI